MGWGRLGRSQQQEQPQAKTSGETWRGTEPWAPSERTVVSAGEGDGVWGVALGQKGCPVSTGLDGDLPVMEPSECRACGQQMVETRWF